MSEALQVSRILVPVDGSEHSHRAARQALHIARAFSSEVIFVHVVSDTLLAELAAREEGGDGERCARERLVEQGLAYLRDVAKEAEEAGVRHRQVVGDGDPCTVICETAASIEADLIVMGRIGHHGARRILMGSVARRVIESSVWPVLIVPASEPDIG